MAPHRQWNEGSRQQKINEETSPTVPGGPENAAIQGLANLLEKVAPLLFRGGNFIFGGLIAFSLVIIPALITIGPADNAILISMACFACSLPLNVTGIALLELAGKAKEVEIDDLALRAFQDARFPDIESYFPPPGAKERLRNRRTSIALAYALGLVSFGVIIALAGLIAAMWHMAWWLGVALFGSTICSVLFGIGALYHAMPPQMQTEQELKRRYRNDET